MIFIIAESSAIRSIDQFARVFTMTKELDQLEIDRSQSFCLLLSVCHNPALVKWFCLMFAYSQIGT